MAIFFLIVAALIIGLITALMLTRSILSLSLINTRLKVSLAVAGCGIRYDSDGNRIAVFCGRLSHRFKSDILVSKKKKEKKPPRAEKDKPKAKPSKKLPLSIIISIIKAGLLFVGRFLSRVQYDDGKLELQPVIANPAMAGMAYGWGQAIGGIFPGLRETISFSPTGNSGQGSISGHIAFSIKNRQIVGLVWRLLRDLPIKELIRYRFSKRGK